jgi:hypothetical protein
VQDWAKEEWKMTNEEIKSAIAVELAKIAEAKKAIGRAGLDIERIQYDCPHTDKRVWTNDDGHGQFKVERCLICGLQKDGGL